MDRLNLEKIGEIGAGAMGDVFARTFALAGFPAVMQGINAEALAGGQAAIQRSLARFAEKGTITTEEIEQTHGRITTATQIEEPPDEVLVIQAIIADITVKSKLLAPLELICDADTIFASNTPSISLTRLAAASVHPERAIGMHFSILCRL